MGAHKRRHKILSDNLNLLLPCYGSDEWWGMRLKVTRATIWKWRNGKTIPDSISLYKIARKLEIPMDWLMENVTLDEKKGRWTKK